MKKLFRKINLPHPWDYVAHFVVCFVGVILLFSLIQKFIVSFSVSLIVSVFIMILVSLYKEYRVDFKVGLGDMVADVFGIGCAVFVLYLFF